MARKSNSFEVQKLEEILVIFFNLNEAIRKMEN